MKIKEILKIANGHLGGSDNELAEFIALKLTENFDLDLADEKQLDAAIRALGHTKVEIQSAIGALSGQYSKLKK